MAVGVSADSECYLGSIFHSLEHLPQWYQVIALLGIFFLFPLREIAVISWLAASLHNSFGTEMVWSDEYQRLLEQMSFNERLCFTLYGVALSVLAFAAYSVFGRDAIYIGIEESGLSGGRKWWPVVIVCAVLGCEGMVILKEEVASTLSDTTSLAYLAVAGFQGIEKANFDPRLANSNIHFIIQLEILKALLVSFLERVVPAVILACGYRLLRDVPRKAHAALRWYIITVMLSRSLIALYVMFRNDEWERQSSWILFASSLSFLGVVNYVFGPSKRGGWTAATSVVSSIHQTIQGIVKCTAIFFVIYLSVLAIVVSVHVVELLLIWLIFFLTTVWIPAIIDSCSMDYAVCIATAISFVARQMDYLTDWGSVRLWGLICLCWLDVCLFYNLATNACQSRYGGIVAVSMLMAGFWRITGRGVGTGDFVTFLETNAAALREIVEEAPPQGDDTLSDRNAMMALFTSLIQYGLAVGLFLIACIALMSVCESRDVRARLHGYNIVILTPGVLFRKFVKTFIFGVCSTIFMVTGLALYRLLPQLAMFAPDFFTLGMAIGLACTILGGLMDMQEFLYVGLMRLLGVMDPPAVNDEEKEIEKSSFIGSSQSSITRRYATGR
ncbi:hypothetical protein DQ04_00111010 [Trypanosoma grayi]|uniref:hypothetical protein n=1 Tax=Trypanosoma grayi TaxID=71804 RepID=UPI0004F471A3|nr:hypothetical protein DQ04_00111010 [Trypanosoma grayi]KEG15301.1 hypothetical protein DQ04_00111010 [Trypanosoma grayi]